jgi:DNA-directed RNA polymerase subunit RPC12/RpoP
MWLPFYKRLDFMARILILVFIIIPASILIGFKGILILISILIRTFTLLIKADKTIVSNYTCEKCGFIKELEQSLKLFKCSQCGHENLIEQP